MPTDFATINGFTLRYSLEGVGPLAVFGHGLMGSIEQVTPAGRQLDALLRRVRLLTYDARGHGQSGGPEDASEYTWETMGRDMSALIDFVGEPQAIVGGASMGAATALWVALERPEQVKALVILMPPPLGHEPQRATAEKQEIATLELISAAVQNFGIEKTVEIARGFPGFAANAEEADERARWLLSQNPLTLLYAIRGLVSAPFHDPEEYRRISVPTTVMAHEGDGLHPARAARLLGEMIPNCILKIAPQPDYWQQHPSEFLGEMAAFLDTLGP
ncbi:MAG: alpha/beta hydrolase [Tepidiformaceae bacterium]